jgi:agmatine deiminase
MSNAVRFPAEWEPHDATWIAWPHNEDDWPGKLPAVQWAFAEIVRHLSGSERVEILCHNDAVLNLAKSQINAHCQHLENCGLHRCRFHLRETNRNWLRDSAPTGVFLNNSLHWRAWNFNAWAKYSDYELDQLVPELIASISQASTTRPMRPDGKLPLTLEAGAIDTDGQGTLLATEECLLSDLQVRNPGMSRAQYEDAFFNLLGVQKVIWLRRGIAGDDTHGHIDDIARFTAPGVVALAVEENPRDRNHEITLENLEILRAARDAAGNRVTVLSLPMPDPLYFNAERLPASYANFYIANTKVLVPTFNCTKDRVALSILEHCFPGRQVVGIHSTDIILGRGSIHCLTQQQPKALPGQVKNSLKSGARVAF